MSRSQWERCAVQVKLKRNLNICLFNKILMRRSSTVTHECFSSIKSQFYGSNWLSMVDKLWNVTSGYPDTTQWCWRHSISLQLVKIRDLKISSGTQNLPQMLLWVASTHQIIKCIINLKTVECSRNLIFSWIKLGDSI